MALSEKFNTLIPRDNQDLLVDDLEVIINSIHEEVADRMNAVDTNWSAANWTGTKQPRGIFYGMELSYNVGSDDIEVTAGEGIVNGYRVEMAGIEVLPVVGTPVLVNDYIVARVSTSDGSARTNPITGVNENMQRTVTSTLVATAAPVAATDVILGRVIAFNGAEPLFGTVGDYTFTEGGNSLTIYPLDGAANSVRGPEGNKHHIRAGVTPSSALGITETLDQSNMGFAYLNIQLKGSATGLNLSTLSEIAAAINGSATYFGAAVTAGVGTYVPTTMQTVMANYVPMTGGEDYRKYYESMTGSESLQKITRFNTGDPFTKHISQKGVGNPSANNPHGLTLEDIGVSGLAVEDHIEREHYDLSSIPRNATSAMLATTINNLDCTIGGGAAGDDCIINGKVYNFSSGYTVSDPSTDFELREFYVNNSGSIQNRVVSSYSSATVVPTYTSIQNGDHVVVNIIDKDKNLSGTKVLRLNIVGGVYSLYFGNSGATVVTPASGPWRMVDPDDLTWIDVYIENEALVDNDYRNTVTFTAFDDTTELPCSMVAWKGNQDEWGYAGASELFIDKRKYGSLDLYHDIRGSTRDQIPTKFTQQDEGGYLYYSAASLDLKVKQFAIEFEGHEYRNSSIQTITLLDNSHCWLLASFDDRNQMTLSIEYGQGTPTFNSRRAVVIGYIRTQAGAITLCREMWLNRDYSRAQEHFNFDIASEDDFWAAMRTTYMLDNSTSRYVITYNLRADISIDLGNSKRTPSATIRASVIQGNGYRMTFTGAGTPIEISNEIKIYNVEFYYTPEVFFFDGTTGYFKGCSITRSGGSAEFFEQSDDKMFMDNCLINGTIRMNLASSTLFATNCTGAMTLEGDGAFRATNCIFGGQDLAKHLIRSGAHSGAIYNNCILSSVTISDAFAEAGITEFIGCKIQSCTLSQSSNGRFVLTNCITTTTTLTNEGDYIVTGCDMSTALGSNAIYMDGTGTIRITGSKISRMELIDPDIVFQMSNSEVTETIELNGISTVFMENVYYSYNVNTRALFEYVQGDTNIYATGIHIYTGNNLGLIRDATTGAGTHTVTINLSDSKVYSTVARSVTFTRLILSMNISNTEWRYYTYISPAGSSIRWSITNSDMRDWYTGVLNNTAVANAVISAVGCYFNWTGTITGGGLAYAGSFHHKGCVIACSNDYFLSNTGNLFLSYDGCNLDSNTYWEIDWGSNDFEVHFSNCELPANFNIDIIDVDSYKLSFTGCNIYDPDITMGGNLTAYSEINVSNCYIYQRGTAMSSGFYFTNCGAQDTSASFSNCVMDCEALIYHDHNVMRYFDINFSNCFGNPGVNLLDVGGNNVWMHVQISNCNFQRAYNALDFQINGCYVLHISSSYLWGNDIFLDISALRIASSFITVDTGEVLDNPDRSCDVYISSSRIYMNAWVPLVRTDNSAYVFVSGTWLEHSSNVGRIVERIVSTGASSNMEIRISGSVVQSMVIEQTKGTLEVVATGNYFDTSYVIAAGAGDQIQLYVDASGNHIYFPITPGWTRMYFVTLEFTGTGVHNTLAEINLSGNSMYCNIATAACLGAGFVGLHTNTTVTTDRPYGFININSCHLRVYSSVDLPVGQEAGILRASATAATIQPIWGGSLNISDCMVYSWASNNTYRNSCIVRGGPISLSLVTYADLADIREDAIQIVISNCHHVGTESSACMVAIQAVDPMEVSIILENISHTYYGAAKDFRVRADTGVDGAEVLVSKVSNADLLEVGTGDDGIMSVQNCVNSVMEIDLYDDTSFMCVGCSHKAVPAATDLITLNDWGANQLIHVGDIHARFPAATNYLVAGNFVMLGGVITSTTQYQGAGSDTCPAPVSSVVNYLY